MNHPGSDQSGERGPDRSLTAFVHTDVAPFAAQWDRDGRAPTSTFRRLAESGHMCSFLPPGFGGRGAGMAEYGRFHEELGRVCSSLRAMVTAHDMVAHTLLRWGDEAQRARWLPRMARGEAIAAFALSEPGAGSDVSSIETTASEEGGTLVLNGRKTWITSGTVADVFLVFAKSPKGHLALLVESGAAGLGVSPLPGMLGLRAAGLAELSFGGCPVSAGNIVGGPGAGLRFVLPSALTLGRYAVACGCVGLSEACLDLSVEHARERRQFGKPIAEHQLVARMLARMLASVRMSRLACERCARMLDSGDPDAVAEAALAKYAASAAAVEAAGHAVQIQGAAGCLSGNPAERFYRDAKIMEIIEGSTQILEILLARHALRERVRPQATGETAHEP